MSLLTLDVDKLRSKTQALVGAFFCEAVQYLWNVVPAPSRFPLSTTSADFATVAATSSRLIHYDK